VVATQAPITARCLLVRICTYVYACQCVCEPFRILPTLRNSVDTDDVITMSSLVVCSLYMRRCRRDAWYVFCVALRVSVCVRRVRSDTPVTQSSPGLISLNRSNDIRSSFAAEARGPGGRTRHAFPVVLDHRWLDIATAFDYRRSVLAAAARKPKGRPKSVDVYARRATCVAPDLLLNILQSPS
jgi:hypothetical protein